MRTKRWSLYQFLASLVVCLAWVGMACAETAKTGRIGPVPDSLNVLYAGNPDSERMADFERFLSEHFAKVGTCDYREFAADDANDYDVVIFDWTSVYPRDENGAISYENGSDMNMPEPPKLDPNYARPSVLIGAVAGTFGNQRRLAINWKCLCLENWAHDVDTKHPIFQGPQKVEIDYEEREKPAEYFLYPGTERMGESFEAWKMQEKNFPEVDPGLVSSRENFLQTPDAEAISGGINGKGPTSVAIGRHGNFLQWGFSGQPSDMTESARNAFVNSICYIEQFDGQAPGQLQYVLPNRDEWLGNIYFLRVASDEFLAKQVEDFRQMVAKRPVPAEELAKVGDDPAAHLRKMFEPVVTSTLEKVPAELREKFKDDNEALIQHYTENLEYLRTDGWDGFQVDADAQQLGISNRSPRLLEKCVQMLESGADPELAHRVLERYTGEKFQTSQEWRTWLQEHVGKLRFEESKGIFVVAAGQ